MEVPALLYLVPVCLLFEVWQLIIAERHIGIKHIESGIDPRDHAPGELLSFIWGSGIVLYWIWMILMLIPDQGRAQIVAMLVISLGGYSLRRNSGLKWVLVILTIEGAIRMGMLVSLVAGVWNSL